MHVARATQGSVATVERLIQSDDKRRCRDTLKQMNRRSMARSQQRARGVPFPLRVACKAVSGRGRQASYPCAIPDL